MNNSKIRLRIFLNNLKAKLSKILADAGLGGIVNGWTELKVEHIRNGKVIKTRKVLNKCITDAFVQQLVDALQAVPTAISGIQTYKHHATGTGFTAEDATQTALVAEIGTRIVGTQVEGTQNQYKSVATITYSGSYAITEHGLFNAATAGVLMDRTLFAPVNVIASDSIQFTFTITINSGS